MALMQQVETAVRRMLLADPTVTGYVGTKVYKHRLLDPIEPTGGRAIVLVRANEWGQPDQVQTPHFPLLEVQCWADPTRNADGTVAAADAEDGAWALMEAVDRRMHAVRGEVWGSLTIVSSNRWTEGVIVPPEAHKKGTDCVFALRRYALETV